MIQTLPLGVFLAAAVAFADLPSPRGPEVLEMYRDLAAKAGRGAEAQVALALWCDANGLESERVKHLALAVLIEPAHATARGLLGLMNDGGKWRRPEEVAERIRSDEARTAALAEYNARRASTPGTADAQWDLARWCEQKGLKAEAIAHFTAVTRLDPSREQAWKHLGLRKHEGRWMTPEQIAEERDEAAAQRRADVRCLDRLRSIKRLFAIRGRLADAQRALAEVTDPRAARAVWTVFAQGGEADQGRAIQLFGQIDAPEASLDLAALAVRSPTPENRRRAIETLVRRDPRDVIGPLIEQIRTPLKYEVRYVRGPGRPGSLFVEGEQFNIRRIYEAPLPPEVRDRRAGLDRDRDRDPPAARTILQVSAKERDDRVSDRDEERREEARDEAASIRRNWEEAQRAAISAEQRLEADLAAVRAYNADVTAYNGRVLPVLHAVTGQDLGSDRQVWLQWWTDQRGYVYKRPQAPKPTYVQDVPPLYQPNFNRVGHSCFAAGTLVRTIGGPRPIEDLAVGDIVLTQDTRTGALSFQPVLAVFHNPPAETLRIDLGGETVVATPIHRFWRAGHGWVMARELKPGDAIRTLAGTARVVALTAEAVQPVFNLEVSAGHAFFVGNDAALVHDNSLVRPQLHPFDAPPELATTPVERPRRSS
jgi:hypothetical protein